MNIFTATLGYPRIGKGREVTKALESFWRNKITAKSLLQTERSTLNNAQC